MQDRLEISLLIDYYGAFLTDNQRELLRLSCDEDYSLSEIAERKGISRQGVRDAITRGEKLLVEMESKLRLVERDRRALSIIHRIQTEADKLNSHYAGTTELSAVISLLSDLADLMEEKDGI